ncbi:MAG: 30S ribosomal protein S8 [Candidatus Doudnabacteria bacterium RIFCSPHIGHO2_01_FULL_46_14]|uniref:Small ribosomal subunit protein uS8 n=1 Tax=Candidatus Doudnabacteria bacterium RIFCSPHIGHO2_01_FULL_46_14 TaxID=1817824 RepID=A0A1F5NKQ6_9BACT|nr:ribosomal protein S8 [uncultured bacterium]OGE78281.1 MAG: 30S ribosomal protein S8 [Candidatus Doudnabacteria bacterium RIFCSPHIGHO2_01_FULL_46_14]
MDPISDMLTRIRNALAVKKTEVVLPYSKLKFNLAQVLQRSGWIGKVADDQEGKMKVLRIGLRYDETGMPTISGITRLSKPGQRIYSKVTKIPRVTLGSGATIVSTSKGLMTSDQARKEKLGGELICQIW